MSRKGRKNRVGAQHRQCAGCQIPISESRPVYLVGTSTGSIVGPFHASCASLFHELAKRDHRGVDGFAPVQGRVSDHFRQGEFIW
jgi:hypothetical protein